LLTCPGRAIDPGDELPRAFDRIRLSAYRDSEKGGGGLRLIPWGQGFKDKGPAIDALEIAIMERKLIHGNIPILNWSVGNAVATTDPAGNRKMDKEKARFRMIRRRRDFASTVQLRWSCAWACARDRGSAHAIDVRALIG
jgi:hypothetical protein